VQLKTQNTPAAYNRLTKSTLCSRDSDLQYRDDRRLAQVLPDSAWARRQLAKVLDASATAAPETGHTHAVAHAVAERRVPQGLRTGRRLLGFALGFAFSTRHCQVLQLDFVFSGSQRTMLLLLALARSLSQSASPPACRTGVHRNTAHFS